MVRKGKHKNSSSSPGCSKKLRVSEDDVTGIFADLPHEILLKIFEHLSIAERSRVARVCRSWLRASYDEILWYHVDISDITLGLKKLMKFFKHRCFANVKSIKICGNLQNFSTLKKQSISKAVMAKLNQSCTSLNKIDIKFSNLSPIEVTDLCKDIKELNLVRCEIPYRWFNLNTFTNLESLDLSYSSRVCSKHLQDLSHTAKITLKILKLKNCYRIDDRAIEVLVEEKFELISHLNLEGTSITQFGLQLIGSKLKDQLVYLNLKDCMKFQKSDIDLLKASFEQNSNLTLES